MQGTEYGERVDPPGKDVSKCKACRQREGGRLGKSKGILGVGGMRAVDMAADKPRLVGTGCVWPLHPTLQL